MSMVAEAIRRALMVEIESKVVLPKREFLAELKAVAHVSGPLMLAMAGNTILMVVDRLCLAAYSEDTLEASGPAVFMAMTAISLFVGITYVGRSLIAQQFSKTGVVDAEVEAIRLLAVGIVSALCFSFAVPILIWLVGFSARGPQVVSLERVFLWWSIPFGVTMILNSIGSCFFSAINRSPVVFRANLVGQVVGITATYCLVFGAFGMPELGMAGSAIGTLLGALSVFVSYILHLPSDLRSRLLSGLANCFVAERPQIYKRFIKGLPIGGHKSADDGGNTAILWATSIVGASALAANNFNIILNYISIIPIIGIANGATVLSSQAIGKNEYERIGGIVKASLLVSVAYISIVAILLSLFSVRITSLFGIQNYSPDVFSMSISITKLLWLYAVSFVLSFISSGVLQSFGQNDFVFRARILVMWCGSVPAAYLIALNVTDEATALRGIWISLSMFEMALGAIFFAKMIQSTRAKSNDLGSILELKGASND